MAGPVILAIEKRKFMDGLRLMTLLWERVVEESNWCVAWFSLTDLHGIDWPGGSKSRQVDQILRNFLVDSDLLIQCTIYMWKISYDVSILVNIYVNFVFRGRFLTYISLSTHILK